MLIKNFKIIRWRNKIRQNRKLYTTREDKRSQFKIMKESIVDFHQAFDYVNQEFQNYNTQKR